MSKVLVFLAGLGLLLVFSSFVQAAPVRRVVINEVAWAGTKANPFDEWIELKNNTDQEISLDGWKLVSESGTINILLSGKIPPGGFYLLERTDDNTVSDVSCDLIYRGALINSGDTLKLIDPAGNIEDTANKKGGAWPAGTASPTYASMERIDPSGEDVPSNWKDNNGKKICGKDSEGNPIRGTPGKENSVSCSHFPTYQLAAGSR